MKFRYQRFLKRTSLPLSTAALVFSVSIILSVFVCVPHVSAEPTTILPEYPYRVVRLMPLGDSITQGHAVPGGYRTVLWQKMVQNDGKSIDFMGTQVGGGNVLLDRDHEGHAGWCIQGVCRGDSTKTLMSGIDGWMAASRPNIILLHAGTNDIATGATGAQTAARLDALLGKIYTNNSGVHVVVAKIIVMQGRSQAGSPWATYNAAIPSIVAKYQKQGRHTEMVDMSRLLNTSTDYTDAWHPNQAGFNKMGAAWYPKASAAYQIVITPKR